MMGANYLYASAACTAASLAGLLWWAVSVLDGIKSDGLVVRGDDSAGVLELLLGSPITVALLANATLHIYVLAMLSIKTLFFVQLYPSESRKLLERFVNYLIYKGTFLPLVVPQNVYQVVMWSTWLIGLGSLKVFQLLAKDRLERLNSSPSTTPSKYFRVFSALLSVLLTVLIWIRLCSKIYRSFRSHLYLLLFFEPLSIGFETLQAVMIHGFQLHDIWNCHSVDSPQEDGDCKTTNSNAGSVSEWKGILLRNFGFLMDLMTLLMALGHYLIIWWLHGMAFHLVDAVLFLNLRALLCAIAKRVRGYIKLRKALSLLDGSLPDATYEELSSYDDECAICRGRMSRAKKLPCKHLFHLSCLRSWLDQGLTEVYACPTCRRPLFLSRSRQLVASTELGNGLVTENSNLGLDPQRISGNILPVGTFPNEQPNPSENIWRGGGRGLDPGWVSQWPNAGIDGASTSDSVRTLGFTGVEMMMRQLTSVGEYYAHGSIEDSTWNLWPPHQASTSSASILTSSLRFNRTAAGIRLRSNSPSVNPNSPEIRAMVNSVQEVLPHIPDELIIQDLVRTNNVNITVNNLLQL